jgi:hypothetical protein
MTAETLEKVKLFVSGHRHRSLVCALSARENGYKQIAAEHENEAHFADLILLELSKGQGT